MKMLLTLGLALGLAASSFGATTARHGLSLTDHENTNDALKRLDIKIPLSAGHPAGVQSIIFCGQLPNNDTTHYLGPISIDGTGAGEGVAADAGGTACDAADSGTQATADNPVWPSTAIKPIGMICRAVTDAGATGSGSNGITFTLEAGASTPAALSPAISCTVPTLGTECSTFLSADSQLTTVAAGSLMDVLAPSTENLSANDGWCKVFYVFAQ